VPFIRQGSYSARAALGLTFAGIPAVLIAAYIVKSMDLSTVKWLVAVVVIYTSITLLRAARQQPLGMQPQPPSGSSPRTD
jgi:uncharacterized membrane protein YfcA